MMTQNAVVTKIINDNTAEISVERPTACGGNCVSCEGCMMSKDVKTEAYNKAGAAVGQSVIVESKTENVFKAVALAYIMPLILFLSGYFLGSIMGLREGLCILLSFLFLALSAVILVIFQRKKSNVTGISYTITKILEDI